MTGYSPEKYINVLDRLNKKTNHGSVFSKTHPTFQSRIDKLNNYVASAQIVSISAPSDLDKRTQRFVKNFSERSK
jgi:predicted Zn-dependent protease